VTLKSSVLIGGAQALAILPGISRSGMTISTGLLLGVGREQAARFSFLMALPVILGVTGLKARRMIGQAQPHEQMYLLVAGAIASAITGYAALRLLLRVLRKGRFSLFAYYCFAVGILGLLFIE
jgi:undecaprenyl-diphosphatase